MAFQQGFPPGLNADSPPVSFVTDDTCDEVMFCIPASVSVETLRGIAQRFCDIDNRAVNVAYYSTLNQYRVFHPNTPLANRLRGHDFLYLLMPTAIPSPNPDAMSNNADDIDDAEHVPRPRNKWILYRQEKSGVILGEKPGLSAGEISKIVADMWKNESEEVKTYWAEKAKEEELQHKEKYPDYQFSANKTKKNPMKRKYSASDSPGSSLPHKNMKYKTPEV